MIRGRTDRFVAISKPALVAAVLDSRPVQRAGRLGIFGGTFDPPHVGHVIAAVSARHELGLERCLVMPANVPWQKTGARRVTPPADRLAMLRLAFAPVAGVELSTLEIDRGGDSYTADTLDELARADSAPQELVVIVGSDVAPGLGTWRRPDALRRQALFAVYERAFSGGGRPPEGWRFVEFEVPAVGISSTMIRARVAAGKPIDGLVDARVNAYISERRLYSAEAA